MPKPVQDPLPIMIGGRGERRTIPTMVRWGHEWNGWCTRRRDMGYFNALIDRLCDAAGRDPANHRPFGRNVILFNYATRRPRPPGSRAAAIGPRPVLVGTPAISLVEQVAAYVSAGTDELIIPGFNMSHPARPLK